MARRSPLAVLAALLLCTAVAAAPNATNATKTKVVYFPDAPPTPPTATKDNVPDKLIAPPPHPPKAPPKPVASPPPSPSPRPPPSPSPEPPTPASPPPPPPVPYSDIGYGRNVATWLQVAPILNFTGFLFEAAGLEATVMDNSLVATLFIPSDAAWDAWFKAASLTPALVLANTPLATKLARNLIVPGVALRLLDLNSGDKLATLGQETLTLRSEHSDTVWMVVSARATASISVPDLIADDSIIHVVDAVLTPESVRVDQAHGH